MELVYSGLVGMLQAIASSLSLCQFTCCSQRLAMSRKERELIAVREKEQRAGRSAKGTASSMDGA